MWTYLEASEAPVSFVDEEAGAAVLGDGKALCLGQAMIRTFSACGPF
jgi:hypothetical protein